MKKHRNLTILLIVCTCLVLKGNTCTDAYQTKDIEQVAGIPIPAEWVSVGWTDANWDDTQTVNLAKDIREAMPTDPEEVNKILSLGVAGVSYKVIESTGHSAQRFGFVNINGLRILDFDIPNNLTGKTGAAGDGSGELTMNSAGTTFVSGRLNTWLAQYKATPFGVADDSLLDFTYYVEWNSDPAPSESSKDNFRWTTDIVVQVVKVVTVF